MSWAVRALQVKGRMIYIREDREDKDLQEELGRLDNGADLKKRPRNNGRSSGGSTRGGGRGGSVTGSVEVGYATKPIGSRNMK